MKYFVACPANYRTGGTELLHQLVNALVFDFNLNATIYYYNYDFKTDINPTPKSFEGYIKDNITFTVEDLSENILIVPEVATHLFYKFKNIEKAIWWLSVDNFFGFTGYKRSRHYYYLTKWYVKKLLLRKGENIYESIFINKTINYHFVQSEYAKLFLMRYNINNNYSLSDYLNEEITSKYIGRTVNKENIIAYNPLKGILFTQKIIDKFSEFTFVPIINLTSEGVANLLLRAKIYIDFGEHPGKDRIPREAVVCGCCIITGLKGAANNNVDIPILSRYKFEETENSIGKIGSLIKYIFEEFELCKSDFNRYRSDILDAKKIFLKEISKIIQIID